MSNGHLRELGIEHLRGSIFPFSLPFDKDKKLTVIYGENATGKTTICDAFEVLGKGKVGSLENRGLGKTSPFWYSVGKKASDVRVSLTTANATCSGIIAKSDVVVQPADARPRVEVLRRSQILDLVEARPGERYTAIARFIDVSGIESCEAALQDLIRDLKRDRETAIARVQENQDTIKQFWETAGRPGIDPIAWAEQETAKDDKALQEELKAIGELRAAHQRLLEYPERFLQRVEAMRTAEKALADANAALQTCLVGVSEGAENIVGILEAAKSFLADRPHPSECPLCHSQEKVSGLSQQVGERLLQFSALREAQRQKKTAQAALDGEKLQMKTLREEATKHANEFNTVHGKYTWQSDTPAPSTPCPTELETLEAWVEATKPLAESWSKAESIRLERSQFLATLKKALDTYKANVKAQEELDLLLPRLEKALKIVADERRTFTDGVLAKIAGEVGRLYEIVHPGEGLDKISLALDPDKRASLDMNASFGKLTGAPPQAYFSQSHLDTLGLCVFLALAALDKPDETILVLDDVLASVDEPHVDRLIELLCAEALRFQHCVITTHYRPWKQKLRWGWLKSGQCQFVELTAWSSTKGLSLIRSVPDVERLASLLQEVPPDPQLVAAKAGVILEAALDFLTMLYECSIPRRANGLHTLGDLLPAIEKSLRKSLRVEVVTGKDANGRSTYTSEALGPILDELTRIAQVRNVLGCHFNTLSFELLDTDALAFGDHVLKLMLVLTCPEHGWPRNNKSGSYWATSNETRRLHPLQQPK